MSYINLYDEQLNEYKNWIKKFNLLLNQVEENILQKDNDAKIEEKLISIGISSVFVSLGTAIASLFGIVAVGLTGGLALFLIGWLFSKGVNKKVFGEERDISSINNQEKLILNEKDKNKNFFRPIEKKLKIRKLQKEVAFTYYIHIEKELSTFQQNLNSYDSSHLALKYRNRHSSLIQKHIILLKKFDLFYKHKRMYAI